MLRRCSNFSPDAGAASAPAGRCGFSLIEVVVAVGIFAVAMVGVIGLFAPIARSVSDSADAEVAARVADALRAKLQAMPLDDVALLLKNSTASGHEITTDDARFDYDLTKDPKLVFASRDGTKIGTYADPIWAKKDGEKFFEIALIRNESVSPKPGAVTSPSGATTTVDPDATAALIGYTARLRWPAFFADSATTAVQVGSHPTGSVRFDHSRTQVLFVAGTVTR